MGKHIFFFHEHDPHTGIFSQWYPHSFRAQLCLPPIPTTTNSTKITYPPGSSASSAPNPSPTTLTFTSAEQYMMYHKSLLAHDRPTSHAILATSSPRKQKALGRAVANLSIEEWERVKFRVVCEGNYAKFTYMADGGDEEQVERCREMREALLGTGDKVLCEASPFDVVWGIGG